MAGRFGPEFWDKFLVREHLGKLQSVNVPLGLLLHLALGALAVLPWLLGGVHRGPVGGWRGGWFVAWVLAVYAVQSSRQLHYLLPAVPFAALHFAAVQRSTWARWALLAIPGLAGLAGAVLLLLLRQPTLSSVFGGLAAASVLLGARRGPTWGVGLVVLLGWAWAVGVVPRVILPPSWPAELRTHAGAQRVLVHGRDTGVVRLVTGVDVHRSWSPIAAAGAVGQRWLVTEPDCVAAGGQALFSWRRLGERAPPETILKALREASLEPLLQPWVLCQVGAP